MKTVATISGSNSSSSINTQLVNFTGTHFSNASVKSIDLRDFDIPIYSTDIEQNDGIPTGVSQLLEAFNQVDAFVFSLPEHNGYMPAFFKNIIDWLSRAESKFFQGKPVLMLSTSPGAKGGASGLEKAAQVFEYFNANIKGTFSLGSFYDNFNGEITATDKLTELKDLVSEFEGSL